MAAPGSSLRGPGLAVQLLSLLEEFEFPLPAHWGAQALAAGAPPQGLRHKGTESPSCARKAHFDGVWSPYSYVFVFVYVVLSIVVGVVVLALRLAEDARNRRGDVLVLSVPTFGGDGTGKACQYLCYRSTCIGSVASWLWATMPWLGNAFLFLLTIANYRLDPLDLAVERKHEAESQWEALVEPFLIVFFLTRLQFIISRQIPTLKTTLFMRRCLPGEAELVLVDLEGELHARPVRVIDGYRKFDLKFIIFVHINNNFSCPGVERLSRALVEERLQNGGLASREARFRQMLVGKNTVNIEVPGILGSLAEEFDSLLYLYQFSCCWWFLFNLSWKSSSTWLFFLFTSGALRSLLITRAARLKTRTLTAASLSTGVRVLREGVVARLRSEDLAPGDVVLIEPHTVVPCDCVLVRGHAVVQEAMLTGEPIPAHRTAPELWPDEPEAGSLEEGSVYAGSEVLEAGGHEEGGALGLVRWIGGATLQAHLVRLWQLPPKEGELQHFSNLRSCVTLLLLVCFVVVGFMVVLYFQSKKLCGVVAPTSFVQRCLFLVLPLANPMLGVAMNGGQLRTVRSLARRGISCLLPPRISMAGLVDTMVLDKTGTITEGTMELRGVDLVKDGSMPNDVCHEDRLHELDLLSRCWVATCSQLSIREGELPVPAKKGSPADSLTVLRVLSFDRARMMSGCVCRLPGGELYVFVKGAAASVQAAASAGTAPADFADKADSWGAQCYYVLGCGVRRLHSDAELLAPRGDLVQGVRPVGLLLFFNPLRKDSETAIARLRAGSVDCVLCTGDSIGSGVGVARLVGIIPADKQVYQVRAEGLAVSTQRIRLPGHDADEAGKASGTTGPSGTDVRNIEDAVSSTVGVLETGVFAVEQEDWEGLLISPMLPFILPRLRVFARMRPEGKVSVVRAYQGIGQVVGMCGDGSNDCGAMRAAHVGLAISAGEASLVAPFAASGRPASAPGRLGSQRPAFSWEATGTCPGGHKMERFQTESIFARPSSIPRVILCNTCGKLQMSGSVMTGCRICNFDICGTCTDKVISTPSQGSRGELPGSLVKLSELILEGRACMATNSACFSYFLAWSISIVHTEFILLWHNGCSLSGHGWTFVDVVLSVVFPGFMVFSGPAENLSGQKPSGLLLGPQLIRGVMACYGLFVLLYGSAAVALFKDTASYQEWDGAKLGISGHALNRMADNFESEVSFLVLAAHLSACAVVYSYGSHQRWPLWRNVGLLVAYAMTLAFLFVLIFSKTSALNCSFRVNCDGERMRERGECFVGPQLANWCNSSDVRSESKQKACVVSTLVAAARRSQTCLPPTEEDLELIPPRWRKLGKINNVLSRDLSAILGALILVHAVAIHAVFRGWVLTPYAFDLERQKRAEYLRMKGAALHWQTLGGWISQLNSPRSQGSECDSPPPSPRGGTARASPGPRRTASLDHRRSHHAFASGRRQSGSLGQRLSAAFGHRSSASPAHWRSCAPLVAPPAPQVFGPEAGRTPSGGGMAAVGTTGTARAGCAVGVELQTYGAERSGADGESEKAQSGEYVYSAP